MVDPVGGGGIGSTGGAGEIRPARRENINTPKIWVKQHVATIPTNSSTSVTMGCALWSQEMNHNSVGIGVQVLVVEEGVPPLEVVLVGVETVVGVRGGPPLEVVLEGVGAVGGVRGGSPPEVVLEGVKTVVGVRGGPPLEVVLEGVEAVGGVRGGSPLELVLEGVEAAVGVEVAVGVKVAVGVEPGVGVKESMATARPGRAWGTSLVRGASVGGWLVTGVTRGVNKSEVLIVTRGVSKSEVLVATRGVSKSEVLVATRGDSAAGRLLMGSSMRARRMVSSAGVRALESSPVERLSLGLTEGVSCWAVYWAGCRIAFTISARNCSSPVGDAGCPFCNTAAASA